MKQDPVGSSITAPIDSPHHVMVMPSCEGGNLLVADRTETLLFSPEMKQLSSAFQLAGHLESQTQLKVLLPGGVIRIGFPMDFDVALDLDLGRTPQAHLERCAMTAFGLAAEHPVPVLDVMKVLLFYPSLWLLRMPAACPSP